MITLTPRTYKRSLIRFLAGSTEVNCRGLLTQEKINETMLLKNPRDRLIMDPARKMNPAFAAAEWYSFMTGEDHINFFTRFVKDYDKFSTDGEHLDGCYGARVSVGVGVNQIQGVINELKRDPSSRRAVISIYDGAKDLFGGGGKNTPCTMTLQFLLRDEKLDCIVNMRSFDLIKGLTYDMYVFTMVQEYIARHLGSFLGHFYHNAGSMHIYHTDLPLVANMGLASRWPFLMLPMPEILSADIQAWSGVVKASLDDPKQFQELAHRPVYSTNWVHKYLTTQAALMVAFAARKTDVDVALRAHDLVVDPTLKRLLRPWLISAGIKDSRRRLGL